MKNIFLILILLISSLSINAQDVTKNSRKELRAERQVQKIKEIRSLLENKTFVFNATHASPMGGGSVDLSYYFDVKIKGDTVFSYLPFYGVAYHVDYGSLKSPFDFVKPIEKFSSQKNKNGYQIAFEASNGNDHINFNFQISDLGFATLNVTSTNRQFISFYGIIDKIEKN